ncbi:MAG: electron transport complex subunit RsxC [Bacillota bacterium]
MTEHVEAVTFPGGIHPPYRKSYTKDKAVERAGEPEVVVIPLHQHTGAPNEAQVAVGDEVRVGQVIGATDAFVSAPVHSSVSGKVKAIELGPHPAMGAKVMSVVIESDGTETLHDSVKPRGDYSDMSPDDVKTIIRDSGIVGLGGAAFPTAVKVSPPKDKPIDTYLLNGAECEPYLTSDHRLMVERADEVVYGLRVLMHASGTPRAVVCVEDNKPDAIAALKKAVAGLENIEVTALHTKYPQGSEKHLIKAVLSREVPTGGLPFHVGVMVSNAGTAVAVSDAFQKGMPLIERVVTVTGSIVKEPRNLLAKIGTRFGDLIEECGGLTGKPSKVLMGGPMMGIAQYTLEVPVIKGTSGILVLSEEEADFGPTVPCVKCARCVDVCPVSLLPLFLAAYSERKMYDMAEASNALDCIECGCCSYVCPARRPLVHAIRVAKAEIMQKKRREMQAAKK